MTLLSSDYRPTDALSIITVVHFTSFRIIIIVTLFSCCPAFWPIEEDGLYHSYCIFIAMLLHMMAILLFRVCLYILALRAFDVEQAMQSQRF